MPYLICISQEGGMDTVYCDSDEKLIEEIKRDTNNSEEAVKIATEFSQNTLIGDFVYYQKGVIIKVFNIKDSYEYSKYKEL